MSKNYKFLANEKELEWFFNNVITKPEDGESYLMCLASRAKKVSMEERARIHLGRGEMMREQVIVPRGKNRLWEFNQFKSYFKRYECPYEGMVTETGDPYPVNSLVLYFYVNPSSEDNVAMDQMEHTFKILIDLVNACRKFHKSGITEQLSKLGGLDVHKKTCRATNLSQHLWTQFDFDFSDEVKKDERKIEVVKNVLREVGNRLYGKGKVVVIRTSGGFHVLVNKEGMRYWADNVRKVDTYKDPINSFLCTVVDELKKSPISVLSTWADEWVKTDQSFLPCPGTYQYGTFEVEVVNKEDFC